MPGQYRNDREHFITLAYQGYVECAIWTALDWSPVDQGEDNPIPLDENYDVTDLSDDASAQMLGDVTDFVTANWQLVRNLDPVQVGHDFSLTRDHHGTGFWDRGLGQLGDILTKNSHPYGETNLYVGDDGQLYVS